MPERDVLEPDDGVGADDAREPAKTLGDHGVALVRHRRGPFLAAAERLCGLGDLGAREVPDLERESLDRRRDERERRQQLGMPVARDDLGRDGLGLQSEAFAGDSLQLRIARRVSSDRTGELSDPHSLECAGQPLPPTLELEGPARKLEPEGRRLCMHPVRPSDAKRVFVLHCASSHGSLRATDPAKQELAGLLHL